MKQSWAVITLVSAFVSSGSADELRHNSEVARECVAGRSSMSVIAVTLKEGRGLPASCEYAIPTGRYRLSIADSLIRIQHTVRFQGLEDDVTTPEIRNAGYARMERALAAVREFWLRHGVIYDLKYSFGLARLSDEDERGLHRITLELGNQRMSDDRLFLRYTKERGFAPEDEDNFARAVAHELAHRLGLLDDYFDPTHPCVDIYGPEGRQKSRPTDVPCPDRAGGCKNLMKSNAVGLSGQAIAPDTFLKIIQPICLIGPTLRR